MKKFSWGGARRQHAGTVRRPRELGDESLRLGARSIGAAGLAKRQNARGLAFLSQGSGGVLVAMFVE